MRFGVGLFTGQIPPDLVGNYADVYSQLLEQAVLSEQVGLDSFWITEHHFTEDGYFAATFPLCGAIAAITSQIVIGPGILGSFYHPITIAESLIALDLLSKGRVLGELAAGYRLEEFLGFGVPEQSRLERLDEIVDVVRAAFTGGRFSFSGRFFEVPEVEVTPHPLTVGGPPLVLTGRSDHLVIRAAQDALIYKVDPSIDWDEVVRVVELYDSVGKSGTAVPQLVIGCYGFISNGNAWEEVRVGFSYARTMYDKWAGLPTRNIADPSDYRLLLGSPDQVLEQVLVYHKAFGDRVHLVLRLSYPGMDARAIGQAIRLYGDVAREARKITKVGSATG